LAINTFLNKRFHHRGTEHTEEFPLLQALNL
jgi:hypothetical protein